MRIAYYTNCYKPRINGVVRSIGAFKRALEELGHDVHLFAPRAPEHTDTEANVHRYPALPFENGTLYRLAVPISPTLSRLTRSLGLDVIHTHHPAGLGWLAWYMSSRLDVPLIYTLHSQYYLYGAYQRVGGGLLAALCTPFVLHFMRQCRRVILPSEAMCQRVCRDAPDLESRLATVPTPLQPEAFARRSDRKVEASRLLREEYGLNHHFAFAVASRLSAEKGLSDLLEAFALLQHRRERVRLLILGDGPVRKNLEKQAAELGVAHAVVFAGMIPFDHIPLHLAAGDAFAYASQCDVQPLVLGEAMAAGLPVVAFDTPSTRAIVVDEQNGLLSQPNARALARRMELLVDREELRARLARAALETARQYDPHVIAGRLVTIYEEAVEEHRRAQSPPAGGR